MSVLSNNYDLRNINDIIIDSLENYVTINSF